MAKAQTPTGMANLPNISPSDDNQSLTCFLKKELKTNLILLKVLQTATRRMVTFSLLYSATADDAVELFSNNSEITA